MNEAESIFVNGGVIFDMPDAYYRKAPGVSNSMLKLYRERMSMEYAVARLAKPKEATPALAFGKAFHHQLLTPDAPKPFVILPEDAPPRPTPKQLESIKNPKNKLSDDTKAAIAWWAAFDEANKGLDVLDATGNYGGKRLVKTAERFKNHPLADEILSDGKSEVSVFAPFSYGGTILRKARMDWVPTGTALVDFKTSMDCSPKGVGKRDEFAQSIFDYDYDMQAAYYLDLWNAANPNDQKSAFVFVALDWVDDLELVGIRTMQSDEKVIKSGRDKYMEAITKFIEYTTSGAIPGYSEKIEMVSIPEWAGKKYAIL